MGQYISQSHIRFEANTHLPKVLVVPVDIDPVLKYTVRRFQTCAMLLTVCIEARVSLAPLEVSSYGKVSLDLKKDNG